MGDSFPIKTRNTKSIYLLESIDIGLGGGGKYDFHRECEADIYIYIPADITPNP